MLTQKILHGLPLHKKRHDGGGLYFVKSSRQTGKWSFRFTRNGRAHEMGLGRYPEVTISQARSRRNQYQEQLNQGQNPLRERQERRHREQHHQSVRFSQVAEECYQQRKLAWKNTKHAKQWIQTLRTYAFSTLDKKPVGELTSQDFERVLQPIWYEKNETAHRLQQRLQKVMSWTITKGLYSKEKNPAAWVENLEYLFVRPYLVQQPCPHPSLRWQNIPAFYAKLCTYQAYSALALRFLILTIGRTSEILGCQRHEIDQHHKTWTLSESRMKRGKAHTVPLSSEAMRIIDVLWKQHNHAYLFPGLNPEKPLSDMAMLMLMKRHFPEIKAVPHGFRASFFSRFRITLLPHAYSGDWIMTRTVMSKASMAQVCRTTHASVCRWCSGA
ncbi:MAG: Prophage CP4-57 integrase [Alphaproteobacteria bacterium MarineAlpha9_Bin2]|nr:MAG: Prophage CP4-57 integrase [Alphaproteobacteria bacterium MarineAlpha9_Bin2]